MTLDCLGQPHVFGHCLAVVRDFGMQTVSTSATITATAAPAAGR
jgi:hypothetical protein